MGAERTDVRSCGDHDERAALIVSNLRTVAAFLVSAEGTIESWPFAAEDQTGYPEGTLVGSPLARLFPENARKSPNAGRIVERARRYGEATYEGWIARSDGERFWGRLSLSVARDADGEVRGLLATLLDWTDRERATRELQDNSITFRKLVETVEEYAIFALSPEGRVESWNAGAQRLKGYRANEVIGTTASKFFPETADFERLIHEASRTGEATYEGLVKRKDETTFWGTVTLSAIQDDDDGALRGFTNIARDMTDRRKNEAALRASEAQFRRMIDSVHEYAFFMLSTTGIVESWNPGAQRLKRYRTQEIIGESYARFFPPEELKKDTPARLLREAAHRNEAIYEGPIVRADGSVFWTHLTLSAVEDEKGQLRGFANVARDLTERKATEDALREREEQMRMLLESLRDHAVYMVSAEGTVGGWSRAAEQLHGHAERDVLGKPLSVLFSPAAVTEGVPGQLLERARVEERVEYDGWLVRRNGTSFWGNVVLATLRDSRGELRGFSNVTRDLTERMRSDRDRTFLAEASAMLTADLDYGSSLENVATLSTRYLADLCVVTFIVGDALQVVAVGHRDPQKQDAVERAVTTFPADAAVVAGPSVVIRNAASELHADVSDDDWVAAMLGLDRDLVAQLNIRSYIGVPLTVHGRALGAMSFFLAGPGRRYGRNDMLVLEELGRRAAVAVDNARSYRRSQDAARLREEVLALVSHDLGTPLAAVEMHAAALARSGNEAGSKILRAVRHMNAMMKDLLDFSSFEAGQLRVEMGEHDPGSILAEAIDLVKPLVDDAGIDVALDTEHGALVTCDRSRIVRALTNLIGNAVKFTGASGAVQVSARVEGGGVAFTVADTGPGIASEDLPFIFDAYRTGSRNANSGAGLGLAIAQRIIVAHRSELLVTSELGSGSTFTFTLPAARLAR